MSASSLLLGLLFSSIGLGFFLYARKQRAPVPLVCGLALMIFPYFISNSLAVLALGSVLTALPWVFRG